jgi:hypothetical protein
MPSQISRCRYCQKTVPTPGAIKRHISHAPACFKAWQNELTQKKSLAEPGNCQDMDGNPSDIEIEDVDMGPILEAPPLDVEPEIGDIVNTDSGHRPVERAGNLCQKETQWSEPYPGQVAKVLGEGETLFQRWENQQQVDGNLEWVPFDNQHEWELAGWLMKSLGQSSIDEYLKLPIVSHQRLSSKKQTGIL